MNALRGFWFSLRFWSKLRSASYWTQLAMIASAYLAFYAVLFVLIGGTTWGFAAPPAMTIRITAVASFLFLEGAKAPEIHSFWGLANKLGLLLLTAFSSSLFTSKMISRQSRLRFSKRLSYYSRAIIESEQSRFDSECLVFRLLNESQDDLYNVRISATLRYCDLRTRTFQHYTCGVINSSIPVLSCEMPFRIYIEMGQIVSAIYKKQLCFADRGDEDISVAELQAEIASGLRPRDADQMILYVEGIDSGEGKLTTASHHYLLREVTEGKFVSIQPRPDGSGFSRLDIRQLFDIVETPVAKRTSTAPPQGV